jgi:hypothetical protein
VLPKYYTLMTPAENPCETPVGFYKTYKLLRPGICYLNATQMRMGWGGGCENLRNSNTKSRKWVRVEDKINCVVLRLSRSVAVLKLAILILSFPAAHFVVLSDLVVFSTSCC